MKIRCHNACQVFWPMPGIYSPSSLFTESIFANLPTHQNLSINLKLALGVILWSFMDGCRGTNIWAVWHTCSELRPSKAIVCFLDTAHSINKCPFHGICRGVLFARLCFCTFQIFLKFHHLLLSFEMAPKRSAESLSGVCKLKRAFCALWKELVC